MTRLVLIDGNAILHRAYHALPPLTTPEGHLVNAVYGFTSMLLKLYADLKPAFMAVAFDRAAPTFRKSVYEKYQANRPKMDEELVEQVELVHAVVRSFNVPIFEKDGFEADDIMGTITKQVISNKSRPPVSPNQSRSERSEADRGEPARQVKVKRECIDQIIIVTGDRDLLQLVEDEKIFLYMPMKGLSEAKLYGEKETMQRMGVAPAKIPDLKALAGDASDNYPGVAGVGPKTAVNLLGQFGSVENLYKNLEKADFEKLGLNPSLREKLIAGKENALLSHQLATIKRDVPIDIDLQPVETLNTPQARDALATLGFQSLLKRLTKNPNEEVNEDKKKEKIKKTGNDDDSQQLALV